MPIKEDNMGKTATPDIFTLSDSVMSMMIDMPQHLRDNIERSVTQAMENPEDFIRYVIIMLGDYRQQLNTVLGALVNEGVLNITEEDDAPSA